MADVPSYLPVSWGRNPNKKVTARKRRPLPGTVVANPRLDNPRSLEDEKFREMNDPGNGGPGGYNYTQANNLAEFRRKLAKATMQRAPVGSIASTGGSGGTGGGTGGGGGSATGPGGEAWEGFAGRYVPGERDLLFSNPGIIVQDWLEGGKYRNNPQMAGDLQRYADIVFGNQNAGGLFELLNQGNLDAGSGGFGDDDQINFLVDLLNQQSKVGGKSPTVEGMLNALYGGFNDPDSSMGGLLTDGEGNPVGTQAAIGALMQFIPLLGEFTGNIRYSNAIRRQANRLAQNYMRDTANGKSKGTFLDYLQSNFLT
jgi:hypothetical protein